MMSEKTGCFRRKTFYLIAVISILATALVFSMVISPQYYYKLVDSYAMVKASPELFKHPELKTTYSYSFAPSNVPNISEELFVKPESERKYFIYDCSGGLCGGLGDRQEGILGAYLLSQMLRRKFRLKMLIPCDISNHLEANKHDWIFKPTEVQGLSFQHYKKLDKSAWTLRDRIAKGLNLETEFPIDVTYFMVNQEMVKFLMKHPSFVNLKWAQNRTATDLYNIVLRRLFKMKPHVQERFNQFQAAARNNGRQLVCAHYRVHGNPTIPTDGYFPEHPTARSVLWRFLSQYNNTDRYRIFVATDSDEVRNHSKRLFPDVIQDMAGNIVHVDRDSHTKKYACDGFAKVILDQQVMATCDVFFMSDSGLGRVGAMLRGTDDGLYCMANQYTDFRRCRFSEDGFFPSYW